MYLATIAGNLQRYVTLTAEEHGREARQARLATTEEMVRAAIGAFEQIWERLRREDWLALEAEAETLRGCLKSSGCCEPTQHPTRHGEVHHRLTAFGQPCIVCAQAARLVEPRQCAFHHPSTKQKHKAFGAFRT
jgi:hypothetical protein